ncbi:lantibiotic dehydratase [Nonomuraea sp. NPDC050328]|uniref:lantibiotic dehydratase n=1 Tax=Nonomuraea sp. NPDC050328 TaxID=3364361 RepID=UPI00378BD640
MEPTRAPGCGAEVHEPLVVRVAGLPAHVLGSLRFDTLFAEAGALVDLESELRTEGVELAEALHPIIGPPPRPTPAPTPVAETTHAPTSGPVWVSAAATAPAGPASPQEAGDATCVEEVGSVVNAGVGGGVVAVSLTDAGLANGGGSGLTNAVRPYVVGLRRALHQGRLPGNGEWSPQVASALPDELAARVACWVERLGDWRRRVADLPEVLEKESTGKLAALRGAAAHPHLRRALAQASPTLSAELDKWLADGDRRLRRASLVRLAKYVSRAAAKTSPYSTFTITGTADWTSDGPAVSLDLSAPVAGVVELDGLPLRRLAQRLRDDPRLRSRLPVRANPSVTLHDGVISFLGPQPDEPILSLPATPALLHCLQVAGAGEPLTRDGLRDRLARRADEAEVVGRFLDGLLDVGLLERQAPIVEHAPDPFVPLTALYGELPEVAEPVRRLCEALDRPVPISDLAGERARQRALQQAADELGLTRGGAGRDLGPGEPSAGPVGRESAVFTGSAASCALPRWADALDDLDTVRRWLGAFDPTLPLRVVLGAFCAERFGPDYRVPFLVVHRAVHEALARPESRHGRLLSAVLTAPPGELVADHGLPRLRELGRIRDAARQAVTESWPGTLKESPASGPALPRVSLPGRPSDLRDTLASRSDALRELLGSRPAWVAGPGSLACYVQPIPGPGPVLLVVNAAHAGYGRGRSRVVQLVERAGGAVSRDPGWPVPLPVAEVGGGFGSALNRRVPSAGYEIDYPFAASGRAEEQRIPLGELEVVPEPGTGLAQLWSRRLNQRVRPMHLGMMADILLPPAARLLTLGFGGSYFLYPSLPPFPAPAPRAGVAVSPRVEVGRVVVQRARWAVPTGLVPVQRKGEQDAGYYLRVLGWVREIGLPERCFVRAPVTGRGRLGAISDKSRKPLYVDFANWLLVLVLDRAVREAGAVVVFEEALPDPATAEGAVTEFLLEIGEGGRA